MKYLRTHYEATTHIFAIKSTIGAKIMTLYQNTSVLKRKRLTTTPTTTTTIIMSLTFPLPLISQTLYIDPMFQRLTILMRFPALTKMIGSPTQFPLVNPYSAFAKSTFFLLICSVNKLIQHTLKEVKE